MARPSFRLWGRARFGKAQHRADAPRHGCVPGRAVDRRRGMVRLACERGSDCAVCDGPGGHAISAATSRFDVCHAGLRGRGGCVPGSGSGSRVPGSVVSVAGAYLVPACAYLVPACAYLVPACAYLVLLFACWLPGLVGRGHISGAGVLVPACWSASCVSNTWPCNPPARPNGVQTPTPRTRGSDGRPALQPPSASTEYLAYQSE
jgi:hypothetical protein